MDDFIYTGQVQNYHIGFSFAVTTEISNASVLMHDLDPISAHIYLRGLTAALLAGQQLGEGEKYNFVWKYTGELKTVLVDLKHDNGVRGFISPGDLSVRAEQIDELFGNECKMDVVRTKFGRVVTASTTESVLQNVVNDLCFFFSYSDQIETDMAVFVGFNPDVERPVAVCKGLLLQALPECDLEQLERVRKRLAEFGPELLGSNSESDNQFEDILNTVFSEEEGRPEILFDERPKPYLDCTCNEDKIVFVAESLPEEDREDILAKQEDLRVHCEFCNKTFCKTAAECRTIWAAE